MEVDDDGGNQPMEVDLNGLNGIHNNTREIGPENPGVEFGPLNFDDKMLAEIHQPRERVLAEIEERLAGPLTQEEQWYWEAQREWWYTVP